jgi:hypothetical protein
MHVYSRTPARTCLAPGFLHSWAFRLIPPATITIVTVGPIAVAIIGPSIAIAIIGPSIAIAVIGPSIPIVATAIVIDVFNGCVALRQR